MRQASNFVDRFDPRHLVATPWCPPSVVCMTLALVGPIPAPAQMAPRPPDGMAAEAQSPNAPASEITLPPIDIVRSRLDLLGSAATASQGAVTKEELDLRPSTGPDNCWRPCPAWW